MIQTKKNNDTMCKRFRPSNISFSYVQSGLLRITKKPNGANRKKYHIFVPNNVKDSQNLYQDKEKLDMHSINLNC